MSVHFWIKTALHRFTPGGFGYYRHLRKYRDSTYDHDREKHPVRHKHNGAHGWDDASGSFTYRRYDTYDEYVVHQQQKLDEMLKTNGGFSNRTVTNYRLRFFRRFKHLPYILPTEAAIVCLGARQGTEVEVLREVGFVNAYGIDLNPGPNNRLVQKGDFMSLLEKTSSIDLIYTNCLDHAFDLNHFFAEHARVIKPEGYALYDFAMDEGEGRGGPFEAVQWERDEEIILLMLRHFKHIVKVESEVGWKWILLRGKHNQESAALG